MNENKVLRDRVRVLEKNDYRERVVELERILGENDTHMRELKHDASRYKEANESLTAKVEELQQNHSNALKVKEEDLERMQTEMLLKVSEMTNLEEKVKTGEENIEYHCNSRNMLKPC